MAIYFKVKVNEKGIVALGDDSTLHVNQTVPMGLGFLALRNTEKMGPHLVRLSGSSRFVYALPIRSGNEYLIGPKGGHRIVPPSEEKNPIKRVLREMDIPISHLLFLQEDENFSSSLSPDLIFNGDKFTIEKKEVAHSDWHIGVYVGRVAVWPGCDPQKLANALAPIVFGEGADADFYAASQDLEAAKNWIKTRYIFNLTPTDHSEEDDRITYRLLSSQEERNEQLFLDFCLRGMTSYGQFPAINKLGHKFGAEALLGEYLSERNKLFLAAQEDIQKAVEWIFSRYRVVATTTGEEEGVKIAPLSEPEDWHHLGHNALDDILRKHAWLTVLLHARAQERAEFVAQYFKQDENAARGHYAFAFDISQDNDLFVVSFLGHTTTPLYFHEGVIMEGGEGENKIREVGTLLSGKERGRVVDFKTLSFEANIAAILKDGDPFFISNSAMFFPIAVGETKNFVIRVDHEWHRDNCSAIGFSVSRTANGLEFKPYDNGKTYSAKVGYVDEITAKSSPLIKG